MKKILLPVLFLFLVMTTFGQDLKKATNYLNDKKYDQAKTEIDAALAKDPANSEALYLKSKVYGLMAASDQFKGQLPADPYGIAFEAFKQAVKDSNNPKVTLLIVKDNYQPIFDIYAGYYGEGANAFNDAAGKSDPAGFAKAMDLFMKADEVGQYLSAKKWANIGTVDTTLVLNIAKAALNAKKNDVAKQYFQKLADAHIKGLKDSADASYELPYQWLTLEYKEAGDSTNMVKYATIGKQLFPQDDYFDFVEMDYYREKGNHPALFQKYSELTSKNPDSLRFHLNYATELFSYIYNSDEGTVIENKDQLLNTLESELEKASKLAPTNSSVNLIYAQFFYNKGILALDQAQKIKGTKLTPEQQKNKTDLTAEGKDNLTKAIPYAQKVSMTLEEGFKKDDRSKYKSTTNLLQNIYQSLGDKDKLKIYQDKYDQADTKFVN